MEIPDIIVAAILGLLGTIIVALIGILFPVYRSLAGKVDKLREDVSKIQVREEDLQKRVSWCERQIEATIDKMNELDIIIKTYKGQIESVTLFLKETRGGRSE